MTDKDPLATAQVRTLRQSDLKACPHIIINPNHYRGDGSCKCSNAVHRAMMIRDWGYTTKDFANVPLVD